MALGSYTQQVLVSGYDLWNQKLLSCEICNAGGKLAYWWQIAISIGCQRTCLWVPLNSFCYLPRGWQIIHRENNDLGCLAIPMRPSGYAFWDACFFSARYKKTRRLLLSVVYCANGKLVEIYLLLGVELYVTHSVLIVFPWRNLSHVWVTVIGHDFQCLYFFYESVDIGKSLSTRRKKLEQYTMGCLKSGSRKIEEVWQVQQDQRSANYLNIRLAVLSDWFPVFVLTDINLIYICL